MAACYHARQVWSFNANPPMDTQPDAMVLRAYEVENHYVPGRPSTDQGCVEQDVLTFWQQTGMPLSSGAVDKLLMWVEIDPRNLPDVREAIYECALVYVGFKFPAYLMPPPPVWRLDPSGDNTIIGGHAVVLPGYYSSAGLFDVISWGAKYQMGTGFFKTFVDEVYALIDSMWIEKTGLTPLGLSPSQLEALAQGL